MYKKCTVIYIVGYARSPYASGIPIHFIPIKPWVDLC